MAKLTIVNKVLPVCKRYRFSSSVGGGIYVYKDENGVTKTIYVTSTVEVNLTVSEVVRQRDVFVEILGSCDCKTFVYRKYGNVNGKIKYLDCEGVERTVTTSLYRPMEVGASLEDYFCGREIVSFEYKESSFARPVHPSVYDENGCNIPVLEDGEDPIIVDSVNTDIMFSDHKGTRMEVTQGATGTGVFVNTIDETVQGRWFVDNIELNSELGDRNRALIPTDKFGTKNITFRVGDKVSNVLVLVVERDPFSSIGGGGGGCPTLEETLLVNDKGDTALVKDIVVGSTIYTKNDKTNEWEYSKVESFEDSLQPVYRYVFDNGVEVEVSESHAFKSDYSETAYLKYDNILKFGANIVDVNGDIRKVVSREFVGEKMVRSYEIVPSHTYVVKGLLSHNVHRIITDSSRFLDKEVFLDDRR